jgi:two-component system chemotaxis response regulator CheB
MKKKIRVLIADDSITLRAALVALLETDAQIEIVGQAHDGVEAVHLARRLTPDVIAMDVNMPRMDGLRATEAIMAEVPARVLVISAVTEEHQVDLSLRAIAAGALELIAKPRGGVKELKNWGRHVCESIKLMAEVPVVRRHKRVLHEHHGGNVGQVGHVDVIALVASTGGPPALAQVLKELPADLCSPVLIAQHIADGFVSGLVRWFGSVTKLQVQIAQSGQVPKAGIVYLPPDGRDLEIDREGLLRTPMSTGLHCPSGDRLLLSLARVFGNRASGFVLTGMGEDGALGLLALHRAGGPTFAQDESTSVVFGMPQAALNAGAVRTLLPLESVAPAIVELCRKAWR